MHRVAMARRFSQVITAEDKLDRATKRRALGSLQSLKIQPRTAKRYGLALNEFFIWLDMFDHDTPSRIVDFDEMVAKYIEFLWSQGESKKSSRGYLIIAY